MAAAVFTIDCKSYTRASVIEELRSYVNSGKLVSAIFLSSVQRYSRFRGDSELSDLCGRAIEKYIIEHPGCGLSKRIPLLDREEGEYKLSVFNSSLSLEMKYQGSSRVEVNSEISMPRTLYYLLFVYAALSEGNKPNKFPILDGPVNVDSEDYALSNLEQNELLTSTKSLEGAIEGLFSSLKIVGSKMTWGDVLSLLNHVYGELDRIYEEAESGNSQVYTHDKQRRGLYYNFYHHCYRDKFKEVIRQALALEWSSRPETELVYRTSNLYLDSPVREDQEGDPHSLSYSTSPLGGIIFEGGPSGTCPVSFYLYWGNREFYALVLTGEETERYFYWPKVCLGLTALTASGEGSHPRLKTLMTPESSEKVVSGLQHNRVSGISLDPSFVNNSKKQYLLKVSEIYRKTFTLLLLTARDIVTPPL